MVVSISAYGAFRSRYSRQNVWFADLHLGAYFLRKTIRKKGDRCIGITTFQAKNQTIGCEIHLMGMIRKQFYDRVNAVSVKKSVRASTCVHLLQALWTYTIRRRHIIRRASGAHYLITGRKQFSAPWALRRKQKSQQSLKKRVHRGGPPTQMTNIHVLTESSANM